MNTTRPADTDQPAMAAFWPLLLLAISLGTILVWNVILGAREFYAAQRMNDQLREGLRQASQTEENVKAMFMDLLALSVTDPEAKAMVDKYNVRYTPPGAVAPAAMATPAPRPASTNAPTPKPVPAPTR